MEMIKKNINKIVIGIVLIFIMTFIYNYTKKEGNPSGVEEVMVSGSGDLVADEIVRTLGELEKIQINETFFIENLSQNGNNLVSFYDLIDFSEKEIAEKPKGKINPFVSLKETFNDSSNSNQNNNSEDDTQNNLE